MEAEIVSRTKKKQHVEELQKLGAALIDLPSVTLDALELPAVLLAAVREAQRITRHEARRRQVQFIGKVMRKIDPEPVRAALAAIDGHSAAARIRPLADIHRDAVMPMPLSRLCSIVSGSSLRTVTDSPRPSETSHSQAEAPARRAASSTSCANPCSCSGA